MQKMARQLSLPLAGLLAACGVPGAGALSVLTASSGGTTVEASMVSSALSSEWKACADAESEGMRFWALQWGAMETELVQLQAVIAGAPAQAATVAAENATRSQAVTGAQQVPKETGVAKTGEATATVAPVKHHNPLAGLKLNLDPKSPADLMPMLAMLKGLYEDGKERIGKLNAQEKVWKQQFEEKKGVHEQHLSTIAARLKNGTLSKEFAANKTKDEMHLWTYWEHVREIQHHQYHTSLKIQHGTLQKEKQMMDLYEKTIAGKESKKQLAKEFAAKVGGAAAAPEVVFVQEALVVVHAAKAAALLHRHSYASPSQ